MKWITREIDESIRNRGIWWKWGRMNWRLMAVCFYDSMNSMGNLLACRWFAFNAEKKPHEEFPKKTVRMTHQWWLLFLAFSSESNPFRFSEPRCNVSKKNHQMVLAAAKICSIHKSKSRWKNAISLNSNPYKALRYLTPRCGKWCESPNDG